MRLRLLCALLVLGTGLAGCSDEPQTIVLSSGDSTPRTALPEPVGRGEGHIAGFVMDEALRILPDVRVSLPSFDLHDTTDRKGEFSFVDLAPGAYFLEVNHTGFLPVGTVLEVPKDDFVRVKVILKATPPPEPWSVTWEFNGYVPWTNTAIGLVEFVDTFAIDIEEPELHTILLETSMDAHGLGGTNGFRYTLGPGECCDTFVSGEGGSELRVEFPIAGTEMLQDSYRIGLRPFSFPTPEVDKDFEVFVTAFFNGPPPDGWTLSGSDA